MLNLVENEEKGIVIIDEFEIEGFVDDKICPNCMQYRVYYDSYDAFFCPQCNKWLESACSDPSCEFCRKRPDKPLLIEN